MAHEELKKQYEEDKLVYLNPWELWQYKKLLDKHWYNFKVTGPSWYKDYEYRRKQEDKKVGHKHAKLMMEYAKDAMENEEPWKLWQCRWHDVSKWDDIDGNPCWLSHIEYGRKPKYIYINGFQVPEPVTDSSRFMDFEKYFYPSLSSPTLYRHSQWVDCNTDRSRLDQGIIHLSCNDAICHSKALLSFTKK